MKPLKWWQNTIVYEAYPSSFMDSNNDGYGDLNGLTGKLDYLASLGVGAIWLTPIYGSPMGDNGYDVSDYYSINPRYGTMEDMDRLIAEADKRNIKIVMDLVFNHTSDQCEWFLESKKDRTNPKNDWYIWRDAAEDGGAPNNWRGIFGGSAWTWCEERQQYYMHTFADFQPDVNWENPDLRQALYDIANFWVNKGVGGFRVDAVTYIKKPSDFSDGPAEAYDGMSPVHDMTANTEGILDFLHEFKEKVQEGHDIFMVGEANGVPPEELKAWVGEDGVFNMIFEFSHVNVQFSGGEIWCRTKDWKLTELKKCFTDSETSTADNGWYPVFLENHDQPRCVSHFLPDGADPVMGAKALGMLVMTLRGTPFLFEGQELGMPNVNRASIDEYNDISSHNQYRTALAQGFSEEEALACVWKYSRDNARTPMQWNASANGGFSEGTPWLSVGSSYLTVNAEAEEKDPDSVLSWYRALNAMRKEHPVFIDGTYEELMADSEEIYAYRRENEEETAVILINFTGSPAAYSTDLTQNGTLIISNVKERAEGILQPYEAICVIQKK